MNFRNFTTFTVYVGGYILLAYLVKIFEVFVFFFKIGNLVNIV